MQSQWATGRVPGRPLPFCLFDHGRARLCSRVGKRTFQPLSGVEYERPTLPSPPMHDSSLPESADITPRHPGERPKLRPLIGVPEGALKENRRRGAIKGAITDDAQLVEALGHPVQIVPGAVENIKITTGHDLAMAERYLKSRKVEAPKPRGPFDDDQFR